MRTGQVLVALATALLASVVVDGAGYSGLPAVLIVPVVYGAVRVLWATIARTRYWYNRDGNAVPRHCPECDQYLYAMKGDWFVRCHRCGWIKGKPVVRWVRYSTPAIMFRRSIGEFKTGVGLLLLIGVSLVAFQMGLFSAAGAVEVSSTERITPSDAVTEAPDSEQFNSAEVEQLFLKKLNAERSARGLGTLTQREVLTEMGRLHSQDMAANGYIGHEEPDGSTIQSRYERRGLLPECRLEMPNSDRYYPGAENVYQGWVNKDLSTSNGVVYVDDERDAAKVMYLWWMKSDTHRRAMLVPSADEAGLGITITDSGKLYASLELC